MKTMKSYTHSPTPSLTRSPAPQSPLASYRERVESAYAEVGRRQGEFIRSVCAFGALLDEVAAFLGTAHGGDRKSKSGLAELEDGTLQSWLAENCPEINYNTAMGYRSLAMKAARMLGGGTQAIAALQGRDTVAEPGTGDVIYVDDAVVEKRDELFENADSRRKLEQAYFSFMSADEAKAARAKAWAERPPLVKLTPQKEAEVIWTRLMQELDKRTTLDVIPLLGLRAADVCYRRVKELADALKARVEEGV